MFPVFFLKFGEFGLGHTEMRGLERLPFLFAVTVEPGIVAAIRMTHQIVQPRLFPILRSGVSVHNYTVEEDRRKARLGFWQDTDFTL